MSQKIKQAAIYIRCSSDEAKKNKEKKKYTYSPGTQMQGCKKLIVSDGNQLNEKNIYSDIGLSGGTDKRPGLQKLLEDAEAKEFNFVYVYRIDRFFRSLPLLIKTVNKLKSLEIGFKSATEPFDTTTPTGRAMFHMAGTFAEWQREIGLEARNEGMIKAMREGKWLGGVPPYGYGFDKETQKLKIDKEEVKIVKMLYEWLVDEKMSEYKIQQKINAMKVPTKFDRIGRKKKTGSKFWWNRRTIARILRNPVYTGTYHYRKYKYLGRVKGSHNLRPKKEWIKVENPSLRIISKDVFKKAEQQLKKNKKFSPRNTKQLYTLQHKIVCGFDGYRYQCATRHYLNKDGSHRKTKYYFCTGNRSYFTPKKCSAPTISESRILPAVWEKLKEILVSPEKIIPEIEKYSHQKKETDQIQIKLDNIKIALSSLKVKRERCAELYTEGSIDKSFYDKKIKACEKEAEELNKEQEKLSQLILTEKEKQKRVQSIKKLYYHLKDSLENATYEVKREILQCLVEKIIKVDNNLDIEFNLPFNENYLSPDFVFCRDNRRMD